MIVPREKIIEFCSESFDEGAKATMESLIIALEGIHALNPGMSFSDVIKLIKEMKSRSNITNGNA